MRRMSIPLVSVLWFPYPEFCEAQANCTCRVWRNSIRVFGLGEKLKN